jgi:hypothetical protein
MDARSRSPILHARSLGARCQVQVFLGRAPREKASCHSELDSRGIGIATHPWFSGEINYLIQSKNLEPKYNKTSQTMELVYDNQWIGYENPETIAKKLDFVLKRAMPGVLIWATDLDLNDNLLSAVIGKSLVELPSPTDCPADGVWPRTEAGKKATVPCDGGGSTRSRPCVGPSWGEEQNFFCGQSQMMLEAFGKCNN